MRAGIPAKPGSGFVNFITILYDITL
jgi:hypothetical protein